MANPNKSPIKGFIKEVEKSPSYKKQHLNKRFDYVKEIVESKTVPLNTPRRLAEHKSVREPKTNIVEEHNKFVQERRKK